jgi:hypothetical protein
VIGNCIAIVDQAVPVWTDAVLAAGDVLANVESFQWEVDAAVHLLADGSAREHHTHTVPRLGLLESLKVDNEDWRCPVDLQDLSCLNVLFAFVAVPFVVFVQYLWLLELLEAVIDGDVGSLSFLLEVLILSPHCSVDAG